MEQLYLADVSSGKLLYGFPERNSHDCCRHWVLVVNLRDLAPEQHYFEILTESGVVCYGIDQNLMLVAEFGFRVPPHGGHQFVFTESAFQQLCSVMSATFIQQFFQTTSQKDAFRRGVPGIKAFSKFTPAAFQCMKQRLLQMIQTQFIVYDGFQLRFAGQIFTMRPGYLDVFRHCYKGSTVFLKIGRKNVVVRAVGDCLVFADGTSWQYSVELALLQTLFSNWQ